MPREPLVYLLFGDWIAAEEHRNTGWLIVARHTPGEVSSLFTQSALLRATDENLEILFRESAYGFHPRSAGYPGWDVASGQPVYYRDAASMGELGFQAFTIMRGSPIPTRYPCHFELLQEFVLYHEAHYDENKKHWVTFDDCRQDVVVARRGESQNGEHWIEASVTAVRDFLTTGPFVLVRGHDHRREQPHVPLPDGEETLTETTKDEDRLFKVVVSDRGFAGDVTWSRLLGFDIVHPFPEVPAERRSWDRSAKQCERFIIDLDDSGEPIERSCGGVIHEDKGVDGVDPLTPVYFRLEVLDKYRNDPERYDAGKPAIEHDVNDEGLVQVYLTDLELMPYREQRYWKHFNVPPSGGITSERFAQDSLLRRPPPRDLTRRLRNALHGVSLASTKHLGFDLFLPLSPSDAHVEHGLHFPIADRAGDFDKQLAALAKLLCDSINVPELKRLTGPKTERDGDIKGSINLLHASLIHLGAPRACADEMMSPMRALQSLRSTGTAHRRGTNWGQALESAGLSGRSGPDIHKELLSQLLEGLDRVQVFLQSLTSPDERHEEQSK